MALYFPVSDLTHLLTSLILVLPPSPSVTHTPHASSPMLPFQTPISVSRSFTFSLLAHRISKSLSHPGAFSTFSSYFPRLTLLCLGSLPLLFLFFIPGNSLPILQVQPARPGPLSLPCSQGSGTVLISAFPFSLPWGLGSFLLLRPRKFKYVEEDGEL